MKITEITQCKRDLEFAITHQHSAPLPVSWCGYLLTGFDRLEGQCVELPPDEKLEIVMFGLYPTLAFCEMSRLYQRVTAASLDFDWTLFLAQYQIRFSEDVRETLSRLSQWPPEFQDWCQAKDISMKDLIPLKNVPVSALNEQLKTLARLMPTRSEGVKMIEYLVDLYLANVSMPVAEKNWNQWMQDLRNLRYPLAQAQEKSAVTLQKELPWPKKLNVRYQRQGDRSGYEIRFFVHSRNELSQQIQGLKSVENELAARDIESL